MLRKDNTSFITSSYYKCKGVIVVNYLYVCNTSSDTISKININDFKEEKKIELGTNYVDRIGPHGICTYKDKLLVVNNYSNDLSIIEQGKEKESYYVGVHCNDIGVINSKAYILCGDINSIIVFDLLKKEILEQIPCGEMPHSIDINTKNKMLLVTNMNDDTISLIDCNKAHEIKNIRVGAFPTKAAFSRDGEFVFVCESNLGGYSRGSISIFSARNFKLINRITVGYSPVDLLCDSEFCYVTNFGDGSISIFNINTYKSIKNINIGGMPRGIKKLDKYLYVGDNYNNLLIEVDITNENKKAICVGGEPTGMALI